MSKEKRKAKIDALDQLVGVLNQQTSNNAGDLLREVLHDMNDAVAVAAPKVKAKAKPKAR